MKNWIVILTTLYLSLTSWTQVNTPTFDWVKTTGTTDRVQGVEIAIDSNGDLIVLGTINGTADFDPGLGVSSITTTTECAFVAKYNSTGDFLWVKHFASTYASYFNDVKLDDNNNIYVAGRFYDDVDLDPAVGTNIITTPGYETLLIKLSSTGNVVYSYHAPVSSGLNSANAFTVNSLGEVYLDCFSSGVSDFDPGPGTAIMDYAVTGTIYYLVKIKQDGTLLWVKPTRAEIYSMSITELDQVLITGPFDNDIIDIDPGSGVVPVTNTPGTSATYILRIDTGANYLDHFTLESNDFVYVNNIVYQETSQNIIISGSFSGETNFEVGTSNHIDSTAEENLFVGRYELNGTCAWITRSESSPLSGYINDRDLFVDSHENIYVVGEFQGSYDTELGADSSMLDPSDGTGFIVKWDGFGNHQWSYAYINGRLGGVVTSSDTKSIYTNGYIDNLSNVDPNGTQNIDAPLDDMFLLKWNNCSIDTTISQGVNILFSNENSSGTSYQWFDCITSNPIPGETNSTLTITSNGVYQVLITQNGCASFSNCIVVNNISVINEVLTDIILFPNPTLNIFNISGLEGVSNLKVNDELGRTIMVIPNYTSGELINIENLSSGLYFIQIETNDSFVVKPLIKKQ